MKILIDPALAIFIKDFTDKQCAELCRCIFEYPNRDCDLGIWQYMKKQIQADEKKYNDKCERVAQIRKVRQRLKSGVISNMKIDMVSPVEEVERKENKSIFLVYMGCSFSHFISYISGAMKSSVPIN